MRPVPEPRDQLFRQEALQHYAEYRAHGNLLRLSPRWAAWAYGLLVAVLVVGALYAVFGTVYEYASGPAIVRIEGRTDLTARAAGTVADVLVRPGQRVAEGELLVRFYLSQEGAELDRIQHEFDGQLVKILRDPADQAARQALTSLRAQRELAQAHLEERSVRAPQAGVVSDIRIRRGQHLDPGDRLLTMVGAEARCAVVALLPGQYRPLLRPGMALRLELTGFKYAYRELQIDSIGDELVGPSEVKRYLGQDLADTVAVAGPVVIVQAHLPTSTFVANHRAFHYYDGMPGTAEARVRAESILVTLVPGLKAIFESRGG
jgi:membrane fusion protein (multidrug efflux system)